MQAKKKISNNQPIEAGPSAIHGYGVFATRDIAEHENIEECPVLILPKKLLIKEISNYPFGWDNKHSALALGYGGLYNHANNPNAYYLQDYKNQLLIFRAAKDIKKGEEIFCDYGQKWFKDRNMRIHTYRNNKRLFNMPYLLEIVLLAVIIVIFLYLW